MAVTPGRQLGGLPVKFGWQEQTQAPFISRFWLLGPQGSGLQGSSGTTGSEKGLENKNKTDGLFEEGLPNMEF